MTIAESRRHIQGGEGSIYSFGLQGCARHGHWDSVSMRRESSLLDICHQDVAKLAHYRFRPFGGAGADR